MLPGGEKAVVGRQIQEEPRLVTHTTLCNRSLVTYINSLRHFPKTATYPQYNRAMTLSGLILSVNRRLPVPSKSQSDDDNLANNRTMHPQQHATCAAVFIAGLPQLRRRSLCLSAPSMTSLSRAAGSNSEIL